MAKPATKIRHCPKFVAIRQSAIEAYCESCVAFLKSRMNLAGSLSHKKRGAEVWHLSCTLTADKRGGPLGPGL
jgi:hypothetical protein